MAKKDSSVAKKELKKDYKKFVKSRGPEYAKDLKDIRKRNIKEKGLIRKVKGL